MPDRPEMSASISSSHGSGRVSARRWTSSETGVPCRLQPRNGTALRRTLVSSTAPCSRSSARSPSPSASASWAWATSARPRTAGCGVTGPRRRLVEVADGGAAVAGEVGAQAADQRRLGGGADLRELRLELAEERTVAGQAGQERALEQQHDGQVGGQRWRLQRDLERELGGGDRAVGELEPRRAGSASRTGSSGRPRGRGAASSSSGLRPRGAAAAR